MPTIGCNQCGAYVGQNHASNCPTLTAPPAPRQPTCNQCGALAGQMHASDCPTLG